MTHSEVILEIDAYIERLSGAPTQSEVKNGWDSAHRERAIRMMTDYRQALVERTELPKWSIVRTMDSWGVDGDLFDKACAIANHAQAISK